MALYLLASGTATSEERFPVPTPEEIMLAKDTVIQLGKQEVFGLNSAELSNFLLDRMVRGVSKDFHYFNSNPSSLTEEQAQKPATLLLHAYKSNQGEWIPFLSAVDEYNNSASENSKTGPLFTLNFRDEGELQDLIQKINEIKNIYQIAGASKVELYLVGHSLGGTLAATYAFDPSLSQEDVLIKKVVTVASRLKNIEPPIQTPYYPSSYQFLHEIDQLWNNIELNRGMTELYTIAAENDWLITQESALVGDNEDSNIVIPHAGHALINRFKETTQAIFFCLYNLQIP